MIFVALTNWTIGVVLSCSPDACQLENWILNYSNSSIANLFQKALLSLEQFHANRVTDCSNQSSISRHNTTLCAIRSPFFFQRDLITIHARVSKKRNKKSSSNAQHSMAFKRVLWIGNSQQANRVLRQLVRRLALHLRLASERSAARFVIL